MTIAAKIIADSVYNESRYYEPTYFEFDGNLRYNTDRLTTFQLRYPRFIHAELMTHRVFSRNASSSRAIPVERLIKDVLEDTAMPIHWGKNIPGMQANEENYSPVWISGENGLEAYDSIQAWLVARDNAIKVAQAFSDSGYHKQIVNRLLEPFSHINVVVTSNDWTNFLELRDHKDAQPEIRELAYQIKNLLLTEVPTQLEFNQWHLPYIVADDYLQAFFDRETLSILNIEQNIYKKLAKISTARCARVSYMTHDGKTPDFKKDLELFDKLITQKPLHASPAEHQAKLVKEMIKNSNFAQSNWFQFRKMIEGGYSWRI